VSRPFIFALLGAAGAGAGTFLPAVNVDLVGVVRYWDAARVEALILLTSAAFALLAAWRRERVGMVMGAVAMWTALLWPWLADLFRDEAGGLTAAAKKVGDAAKDLAKDVAWNFTDLSWGLFVVAAGCLMMSFAALARTGGGGKAAGRARKAKEEED
jgi:hypothetical protein